MPVEDQLNTIKREVERLANLKIRTEAKLDELQKQKEQLDIEIGDLGFDPNNLDHDIAELSKQAEQLIAGIQSKLPKIQG